MGKFIPVDEKEYKERNLWPVGFYAATVIGAVEKLSSNGNLMFQTKFELYNDNGNKTVLTSYILAEGAAKFQLRSFAEGFGLLDEYKNATLEESDFVGKSGYVKLGIEVDKTGAYPDENRITDYRKSPPGTTTAAAVKAAMPKKAATKKETEEDLGDSIPF